jgi:hypothetical protein
MMPVFFFDVQDTEGFSLDADGCEFSCLEEARDEAIRFLPDLARAVLPFGGGCELAVKVRDEQGRYSCVVRLSLETEHLLRSSRTNPAAERANGPRSTDVALTELARVVVHPVAAADAAVSRLAARLSAQYFLRILEMVGEHAGGDLMAGLVLRAITAGNTGYLDQEPNTFGQFASLEDIPPDDVRRPISISAVAGSLGLPYETTRRHVSKLVKTGQCVRVRGGVVAPSAKMQGPWEHQAVLANLASLRRLVRTLKRAGVDFD